MNFFSEIFSTLKLGGVLMIPLSLLSILALALIFDKIMFYKKSLYLSKDLLALIETYNFSWQKLESELRELPEENSYRRFFSVIFHNKNKPIWWLESRAADEAKQIEKNLVSTLWILETITTAAPLLGLLGTIVGMMSSFKIIGAEGLVNPTGVTGGVAESLIATGFGLAIAIITLFAFNYFSRKNDQVMDEMERLGTKMIDHVRIENNV
jgi:biopolymer transport protein ExbB